MLRFKINHKKLFLLFYALAAIFLLSGGWLWFNKVYLDPERVFWGTIERGLATRSVAISASQEQGDTSLSQLTQYQLGADNKSRTLTSLKQGGTSIKSQTIGTPSADYVSYLSIKTDQKNTDGKPLDTSKLVGVWAKTDKDRQQLFKQSVLGAGLPLGGTGFPIGNLSVNDRDKLMDQIREDLVYVVDTKKVKKQIKSGKLLYTYSVKTRPEPYLKLMRQYAKDLGFDDMADLDLASYRGKPALSLEVTIDARSRHITRLQVVGTNHKQDYLAYDVPINIEIPKKTITTTQLQERLSDL